MAIHLHRSNRTESLAESLCNVLEQHLPSDPFLGFPIVVGSRGMERWLRHQIATRMGIAAGLVFPFPSQALRGAASWVLGGASEANAAFWEPELDSSSPKESWDRDALAFRLVKTMRSHLHEPEFSSIRSYLHEGRKPHTGEDVSAVSARELLFCSEVGDVLDRLMHDRPADVLDWAAAPSLADEDHRWLATLLADLEAGTSPESPAVIHKSLLETRATPTTRTMCIFGLSTMRPGERQRLEAIAQWMEIHLFLLVPTDTWMQHQRTRSEAKGALRAAKTDIERQEVTDELAQDNPILTSLGVPSRDIQKWLEEAGYEADMLQAEVAPELTDATALQRLQGWILKAEGIEEAIIAANGGPWRNDSSISMHSTYGAMRQCEVLRDQLLYLFNADPTLEPGDVLVMTPDIQIYAPLVAAVFSRSGVAQTDADNDNSDKSSVLPRIPVSIADLGISRTNAVAEVLLTLIEMSGERVTAPWLLDFMALEPVRLRWQIDEDDLNDIRDLVRESGFRWGIDAADRGTVDQPELDQNTARFALERLALGVLMPDGDDLEVIKDASGRLDPAVPMDVLSRDRIRRAGILTGIVRAVSTHRQAMKSSATPAIWRARFARALDDFTETSEDARWLRAEVNEALDGLDRLGTLLGDLALDRMAIFRWLQGRFDIPQHGDRAITGAVQVCALEPMRSVPFRVVVLLGMDDKSFPRGGRPRAWDPMEQRRPGERDRRESDRHLMLEALLSARDHLLILWSGRDVQRGKVQPAAVPVEELLETLGKLTNCDRDQLVKEHPLQPWSALNFQGQAQSFDRGMADAAVLLREIERGDRQALPAGLVASGQAGLPPDEALPDVLELDILAQALLSPHQVLLRERLQLSVTRAESATEDREPMTLDTLDGWALRRRIVDHLMDKSVHWTDEELLASLHTRIAGEGILPLQAGGEMILDDELQKARQLITHLEDVQGAPSLDTPSVPIEISLRLTDGPLLIGRIEQVLHHEDQSMMQLYTVSKAANQRTKMTAWLHLLAATASGQEVRHARLVGYGSASTKNGAGGDFLTFDGTPAQARQILSQLVEVWKMSRQRPLHLFAKTSYEAARALLDCGGDVQQCLASGKAQAAVEAGWNGGFNQQGDVHDPWVSTFFEGYDPAQNLTDVGPDSIMRLAERVWYPLVQALENGKPLSAAWQRDSDSARMVSS